MDEHESEQGHTQPSSVLRLAGILGDVTLEGGTKCHPQRCGLTPMLFSNRELIVSDHLHSYYGVIGVPFRGDHLYQASRPLVPRLSSDTDSSLRA